MHLLVEKTFYNGMTFVALFKKRFLIVTKQQHESAALGALYMNSLILQTEEKL